jgi:hypothetical protein
LILERPEEGLLFILFISSRLTSVNHEGLRGQKIHACKKQKPTRKQNQAYTCSTSEQFNLKRTARATIRHSSLLVLPQNPVSQAQVTPLQ